MSSLLQFAIAGAALVVIAVVFWRAAEALQRRGIVVRRITMMDAAMTRVVAQYEERQKAARAKPPSPDQDPGPV